MWGFNEAEELSFAEEDAAAIHAALGEIGMKHREVLVLHFLQDLSMADIGKIVGCSEGTVRSRIFYGKKAMKEILKRGGLWKSQMTASRTFSGASSAAENLAAYREETASLLAKHEKALFWEKMPAIVCSVGVIAIVIANSFWAHKIGAALNRTAWFGIGILIFAGALTDLKYRIYPARSTR